MVERQRRMSSTDRRVQLLDACARIVDTEGFYEATIERIATECGVSRTVVYQHFGGLDGLFDALIERAAARAGEAFADAVARWEDQSPGEAMARVLEAVDADPMTWRLFLVIPPSGPPALIDALTAGRASIRRYTAAGLAAGSDTNDVDIELVARFLQVIADECVRLRLADPTEFSIERLVGHYERSVKAMLRAAGVGTTTTKGGRKR